MTISILSLKGKLNGKNLLLHFFFVGYNLMLHDLAIFKLEFCLLLNLFVQTLGLSRSGEV